MVVILHVLPWTQLAVRLAQLLLFELGRRVPLLRTLLRHVVRPVVLFALFVPLLTRELELQPLERHVFVVVLPALRVVQLVHMRLPLGAVHPLLVVGCQRHPKQSHQKGKVLLGLMLSALTATHPYVERELPALGTAQRLCHLVPRVVRATELPLLKRVTV